MEKILFLTSGSKEMHEISGKRLLDSFKKYCESKILICTEGYKLKNKDDNTIEYDLNNNHFLNNWLNKNKDIIPIDLGGEYVITNKSSKNNLLKGQSNYRASQWFRKVASLNYAYNTFILTNKYDKLIWIDLDCELKSKLSIDIILKLFNNKKLFLCYGEARKEKPHGVESGFFGVDGKSTFLEDLFETFENKEFRNNILWGDGHIMAYIIKKYPNKYDLNDLGKGIYEMHIMKYIPILKNLIVHHKGSHRSIVFK